MAYGFTMKNLTVFISYSHKDEDWKDRFVTHLGVLECEGILDLWDDRRIGAGEDWYPEIEKAIEAASVAVLMASADLLTSRFILQEEILISLDCYAYYCKQFILHKE